MLEKNSQVDEVLLKINAMQDFLKYSDEVIPFLDDLDSFIKGIMPPMTEINNSLQDSAHKLPTASDRIDDVTRATESATVAILDSLDNLATSLQGLIGMDKEIQTDSTKYMQTEVDKIVNALQFQDITSQKLMHANRILRAIYKKFSNLFSSLEEARGSNSVGRQVYDVFEENLDQERKRSVREEFEEQTKDEIHQTPISQDDIDSLFS
ncbi:MAG: hypothetical protein L3J79_05605 [Candidatus Marinimicrobia bacterium]|nr:hypothetical protein [Candidatus Neomarinimicrobiota bacterium]